jgi:hypothetical protein
MTTKFIKNVKIVIEKLTMFISNVKMVCLGLNVATPLWDKCEDKTHFQKCVESVQ